jgi:opacity protein-like surface antigen
MVYVLGGYGWQDVSYSGYKYAVDKTFGHLVAGGGLEYKLTDKVTARVEAQHWFESTETILDAGGVTATDSRSDTRVLIGVNYRFNN